MSATRATLHTVLAQFRATLAARFERLICRYLELGLAA